MGRGAPQSCSSTATVILCTVCTHTPAAQEGHTHPQVAFIYTMSASVSPMYHADIKVVSIGYKSGIKVVLPEYRKISIAKSRAKRSSLTPESQFKSWSRSWFRCWVEILKPVLVNALGSDSETGARDQGLYLLIMNLRFPSQRSLKGRVHFNLAFFMFCTGKLWPLVFRVLFRVE
jgi:hypothetical protein